MIINDIGIGLQIIGFILILINAFNSKKLDRSKIIFSDGQYNALSRKNYYLAGIYCVLFGLILQISVFTILCDRTFLKFC